MDLGEIRSQIDDVDNELLELFCKRMNLVKGVAAYKIENNMPVLRPEREAEILERVQNQAGDEFGGYARDFFENMMRISREMQQRLIDDSQSK